MSCFLIPVPPDPLSHMNLSSHPPILPGAGPSLVRWIKDVSDGVMTSAATQRAETSLKCMLLENLNHACIAQIFLAYVAVNGAAMESAEEELFDLLTSHRSVTCYHQGID